MEGHDGSPSPSLLDTEMYRADIGVFSLYPGGDMPIPQEEMYREQQESALTEETREGKAFLCLLLARKHLEKHKDVMLQITQQKSIEMGMREDDVLASLVHTAWASCYNRSLSIAAPSLYSLSPEEAETLIAPDPASARFSQQMIKQLDKAIKRLAVGQARADSVCIFWSP